MTEITKYLECRQHFFDKTIDIEVAIKRNERTTLNLILKARNDKDLADFILAVNETNEAILKLLEWNKQFIQEIMNDSKVLIEGAKIRDLIKDLQLTIEVKENYINQLENETIRTKRTITQTT